MLLIARKKLRHKVFCHMNSLAAFVLCEITDLLLLFVWHHLPFSFHSVELNISFYVSCMSEYVNLKLSKKKLGKFIKIVAEGEREVISAWKSCTKAPFNNKLHSDYHLSVKNSHRVLMLQINQYQGTKQGMFYQGIPYLRCFDIVFRRPYRYFSIALKVILSLSDRYKIFTSDWL